MRIFLTVLILIFSLQSLIKADDISDFEIEGISIGDSVLKHYNKEEIDKAHSMLLGEYKKLLFFTNLTQYESLIIAYKENDKDYIIEGLTGNIIINQDINACYQEMKIMDKEVSTLFENLKRKDWGILKLENEHQTYHPITYDFDNQDRIQIACYDFRVSKNEDNNDGDLLKLSMYKSDYREATKILAEAAN
tara:strand:- start:3511 stop:4086 length:576 start_codon:yes stop_codon:yes gene_type:complete